MSIAKFIKTSIVILTLVMLLSIVMAFTPYFLYTSPETVQNFDIRVVEFWLAVFLWGLVGMSVLYVVTVMFKFDEEDDELLETQKIRRIK